MILSSDLKYKIFKFAEQNISKSALKHVTESEIRN